MLPAPAAKRPPPLLWPPPAAEPPATPWAWVVPAAAGLVRVAGAAAAPPPPPLLLPAPPPAPPPPAALLRAGPGWRVPCEPLLPLFAADQHGAALLHGQWIFGAHSPVIGFSPSSSVEFVPVFPPVYTSTVPPHAGKNWMEKRLPSCKIYLNNAFALDSAWIHPEDSRLFQGNEKPLLLTNQVAMAIARPAAASRPLPTVVLAPQLLPGGCQHSLKAVGGSQALALATAATTALVSVEPEAAQGPAGQPCHLLTFRPIKIPLLAAPLPGSASRLDAHVGPLMPTQVTRVTAVSPAVTLMAANLMDQTLADNGKESSRPSCPPTLILHAERKSSPAESNGDKDHSFKLVNEDDSTTNGSKPVASTPVPGSPWCVVWTGDDRVFFFNPTMQLSVWEKPLDLKHRGDINRLIEDPPHKRKLEPAANVDPYLISPFKASYDLVHSVPTNILEPLASRSKHAAGSLEAAQINVLVLVQGKKTMILASKLREIKDPQAADQGKAETEEKSEEASAPQVTPPLEERITHFRDMLLERGVSAFSTWEKELHKIVFDPRYLLLNSEERKQIFEQFVKTRIREEYKEKKNKLLLAKEEFKKLLEESKLSPRTTFKEFAEKYGRDQRFRLVQKKKDQEHFFNQFILILKKRDKENRIRLRKMR